MVLTYYPVFLNSTNGGIVVSQTEEIISGFSYDKKGENIQGMNISLRDKRFDETGEPLVFSGTIFLNSMSFDFLCDEFLTDNIGAFYCKPNIFENDDMLFHITDIELSFADQAKTISGYVYFENDEIWNLITFSESEKRTRMHRKGDSRMNKKKSHRYLIHLMGLSAALLIYYMFLNEIFLFQIILLLLLWEIIVNLKYPVEHFPRYYLVNALGVLIFMSIIIFRQRGEIWFQWHWMLNYQGTVFVLIAPLFGCGIRRMLTDKKQTIYLAHMLVPGMIMLLIKVGSKGSVPVGTLLMVVLIIIIWQAMGSARIKSHNFWKFMRQVSLDWCFL